MKIGIIGAGKIGSSVGRLWRKAGHEITFGTRHPEELDALAKELGVATGSPADAARFGEVVLLAVPLAALPDLAQTLGADLAGKVVVDANNAYGQRDGEVATKAVAFAGGSSSWVASQLSSARVVKGFNTVNFKTLEKEAHVGQVGIPIAGDDAAALATVERLVRDAGFQPVVVGALAEGARFQPGTPVYNTGMSGEALARALGSSR